MAAPSTNPVDDALAKPFDYIIAGGGTAGLVLAARLSEDSDVRVLVIEAGGDRRADPLVLCPGLVAGVYGKDEYDWNFASVPQVSPIFFPFVHCIPARTPPFNYRYHALHAVSYPPVSTLLAHVDRMDLNLWAGKRERDAHRRWTPFLPHPCCFLPIQEASPSEPYPTHTSLSDMRTQSSSQSRTPKTNAQD